MDIKVGEYVRINNDNRNCIGVGKATKILKDVIYVDMNNKYNLLVSFKIDNITKHSFNLVDLIEVEDYVNGQKVVEKKNPQKCNSILLSDGSRAEEQDVETILTHEQFEANCYKVSEEITNA